MVDLTLAQSVASIRRFNRFYTQRIGVLNEGLLGSTLSLTAVRVLFELAPSVSSLSATELAARLAIDLGYLSRILARLRSLGYVRKTVSKTDRRAARLSLTAAGKRAFAKLNEKADHEVAAMLARFSSGDRRRLVSAMDAIQELLGEPSEPGVPYTLRPHRPGDMGWVVHRHGVLYAHEYGWDERFEALVAEVVAKFIQNFDPNRERCWIAERDGEIVGSVFLVRHTDDVAKLRLLLVEPSARGLGLGSRLVDECVLFAKQKGYQTLSLWTNNVLTDARRVYQRAGFSLVHQEPHQLFGESLIGETWEKDLRD